MSLNFHTFQFKNLQLFIRKRFSHNRTKVNKFPFESRSCEGRNQKGFFMEKKELNYYTSICGKAYVKKNVTVDWWLSEIKFGHLFGEKIKQARVAGKGSEEFERIKTKELPCVTWNFHYDKYKEDQKILGSTGFLYFDIDKTGFDASSLDKSKVFSLFKSVSSKGWSVIVRADGITPENYSSSMRGISKELGIDSFNDFGAVKKSQYTVLSFDPEIYINTECFVFKGENYPPEEIQKKVSLSSNTLHPPQGQGVYVVNDTFLKKEKYTIRLTDATDYIKEGVNYEVFEEKIDVTQIQLPNRKSIQPGARNRVLSTIFSNMLLLNMDVPEDNAYSWLMGINNLICSSPLPEKEVKKIFYSNWKKKGIYKKTKNKKRRIIFKKDCDWSKEDKLSVCRKEIGRLQTKNRKEEIVKTIEELTIEEKITNELLAKQLNISITTVKRYTKDLRYHLLEKNSLNRNIFDSLYRHLYDESVKVNNFYPKYELTKEEYDDYIEFIIGLEQSFEEDLAAGRLYIGDFNHAGCYEVDCESE